jgi:hypothetical protein
MADPRRVELDDLVNRPGTYFNPQTEVLLVVDDSPEIDTEIFDLEDYEGADWIQVSDEVPVDEHQRDELLQAFQVAHGAVPSREPELDDDEEEELPEIDPDA